MDRGKWTPGPWRVSTRANSDRLGICGLVDTVPVMIAGTWLRPTVGEEAANAALIAAAPEMAAALDKLLDEFESRTELDDWTEGEKAAVDKARAAIRMAKGEK